MDDIPAIKIPNIRRVYPQLITAEQIGKIQPMATPNGRGLTFINASTYPDPTMAWHTYIELGSEFRDTRDDTLWRCVKLATTHPTTGFYNLGFALTKLSQSDPEKTTIVEYTVNPKELTDFFEPLDPTLHKIKLIDKVK